MKFFYVAWKGYRNFGHNSSVYVYLAEIMAVLYQSHQAVMYAYYVKNGNGLNRSIIGIILSLPRFQSPSLCEK